MKAELTVEEMARDRSIEKLHDEMRRRRTGDAERCKYCLRPIDDCDCCDADVFPDMGAKG